MIRERVKLVVLLGAIAGMLGCESGWEKGSDVSNWDDSYTFANFNGLYRAVQGTIVFNFSSSSTSGSTGGQLPATTNTPTTVTVVNQKTLLDTGDGSQVVFSSNSGGASMLPIVVPGTITIAAAGVILTDDGAGVLSGPDGSVGTVEYNTGSWSIDFAVPPLDGTEIIATYTYQQTSVLPPGGDDDGDGDGDGSTGQSPSASIYTFNVRHIGNRMTIIDSNGDSYEGIIDGVDFTRGGVNDGTAADGPVVGTITLTGTSRGMGVTIVATFTGNLSGSSLLDRVIQGTWIQADGKTADIFGTSNAIAVTPVTVDPNVDDGGTGTGGTQQP